jgi:L-asparaginase
MPSTDDPRGVLIIYTGGTIGSVPSDPTDPFSPLLPAPEGERMLKYLSNVEDGKIKLYNQRVKISFDQTKQPIDSTEINSDHWIEICSKIASNYEDYEGFVLLHGTDTMAYTASCLAFMLEFLGKPVVVTGSQLPISSTRSDAVQNLVSAIEVAAARSLGRPPIPEVSALFNNVLYRGCRLRKHSASAYGGFLTPNLRPLAEMGEHFVPSDVIPLPHPGAVTLATSTALDPNVASIDIAPGMSPAILSKILGSDEKVMADSALKGVVLKTFGTGNIPSYLLPPIKAVAQRMLIVNVTQCMQGEVEQGLYEVSSGLLSCGVVSGLDMTPEAALMKLRVILGKLGRPGPDAEDAMQLNLRGEQRVSVYNVRFHPDTGAAVFVGGETAEFTHDGRVYRGDEFACAPYDESKLDRAYLHLVGVRLPFDPETSAPKEKEGVIKFNAFLNEKNADKTTSAEKDTCVGSVNKDYDFDRVQELNVVLDITDRARKLVRLGRPCTVQIVPRSGSKFELKRVRVLLHAKS